MNRHFPPPDELNESGPREAGGEVSARDRTLFVDIVRERDELAARFGFPPVWYRGRRSDGAKNDQVSMAVVRALDHALTNPDNAASVLFGRLLPRLPPEHGLVKVNRYGKLTEEMKRKLWTVRLPMESQVADRLMNDAEIVSLLAERPDELAEAVEDPLARINWRLDDRQKQRLANFLGVPTWPARPESWKRWWNFVHNDEVIHYNFAKTARDLLSASERGDMNAIHDLVMETKSEVYLSGINSANSRAVKVGANDLRAEILHNGYVQVMRRLVPPRPQTLAKERTETMQPGAVASDEHDLQNATQRHAKAETKEMISGPADPTRQTKPAKKANTTKNPGITMCDMQELPDAARHHAAVEIKDSIRSLEEPHRTVVILKIEGLTNQEIEVAAQQRARVLSQRHADLQDTIAEAERRGLPIEHETMRACMMLNDEASKLSKVKAKDVTTIAREAARKMGLKPPH